MNDTPYPSIRDMRNEAEVGGFVNQLLRFHDECAREEISYRKKTIQELLENAMHLSRSLDIIRSIEEDYIWKYYDTIKMIEAIHERIWQSIHLYETLLLEEPREHKQARKSYQECIRNIQSTLHNVIPDDIPDNSPLPPRRHHP